MKTFKEILNEGKISSSMDIQDIIRSIEEYFDSLKEFKVNKYDTFTHLV